MYKLTPFKNIKTAEQARFEAIAWQHWLGDNSLAYSELLEYETYFIALAEKFNLTAEFSENGII